MRRRIAGAEERITDLVGRYKEALESRNLEQLKRLWPSLGGAAETALRQEFAHAPQIAVGITDRQISVSGNAGSVSFMRSYGLVTVEGQRLQSTSHGLDGRPSRRQQLGHRRNSLQPR